MQTRRTFLRALTMAAAAAGARPGRADAEPPPETPRLRLYKFPGICLAPQYVAEDLLRAEGFTDVQYLEFPEGGAGVYERVGTGAVDFTQWYGVPFIEEIYALRLREAGVIKATPQKILADGTDWRFLNELKKELKA